MVLWHIPVLFAVGAAASFVNVMAAGGSLLTLPTLLFLGLDSALANGTNRIAIAVESLSAVAGFRAQLARSRTTALTLALTALPGAWLGAELAVQISDQWFRRILVAVMAVAALTMLIPGRRPRATDTAAGPLRRALAYPAMFGVGVYGGFIQAGVGLLFMAVLHRLLRQGLVQANAYKVFITLLYTLSALAVFLWTGNVDWPLGLALAGGSATGAWLGSRVTLRGGERAVRAVVLVALLLMALRLALA
ncbi:MAG TPA: sulfite exporter TauE/SafE family protein [Gammaproteobacteria bacterium]|nr:sulfite exporter TauE/SafE family protein [Gammaproteobacteria bacterium]